MRSVEPVKAKDIGFFEVGSVYKSFLDILRIDKELFTLNDHDLEVFVHRIVSVLQLDSVQTEEKEAIIKEVR